MKLALADGEPGTVSHGTLRSQDLIPRFIETIDALIEKHAFKTGADEPIRVQWIGKLQDELGAIERRRTAPEYYDSEESDSDLEWLIDALEWFAPDGHSFGTHEGDGSDFGFWPTDDA